MRFDSYQPIYLQVADWLCQQIAATSSETSQRIPSVRELAVRLETNPNTIQRAYAYLQELKIIEARRGIGYFSTTDAVVRIHDAKREEFLRLELPRFVARLELLGLTFADAERHWQQYRREIAAGAEGKEER